MFGSAMSFAFLLWQDARGAEQSCGTAFRVAEQENKRMHENLMQPLFCSVSEVGIETACLRPRRP